MHNSNRMTLDYPLDPFFKTSPNLLCIAGFDGYFKRINPAVCQTLGYSEDELMSRPIREFIHPDDRELTAQHRDSLLKGKALLNFENRYLHKDGEVVWLSWNSIPLDDSHLVYAIAKDITHIKSREAHRNELLSDLTAVNQRLRHLTDATAHDIRAPVAGLVALSSLVDTSHISDPDTVEVLGALEQAAEDLLVMLDRYVDNLKNETYHSMMESLKLGDVFNQVSASLRFLIKRAGTQISLDFDDCSRVYFSRSYLEGIFINLLTNSIKYAHPHRIPEVRVCSRRVKRGVEVTFSDNGIGFDSERHQEKLFKLHHKFHDRDDSKGVGLYLVHHYMSSLGGSISVKSEVGHGAHFSLFFPDHETTS